MTFNNLNRIASQTNCISDFPSSRNHWATQLAKVHKKPCISQISAANRHTYALGLSSCRSAVWGPNASVVCLCRCVFDCDCLSCMLLGRARSARTSPHPSLPRVSSMEKHMVVKGSAGLRASQCAFDVLVPFDGRRQQAPYLLVNGVAASGLRAPALASQVAKQRR